MHEWCVPMEACLINLTQKLAICSLSQLIKHVDIVPGRIGNLALMRVVMTIPVQEPNDNAENA